MEQAATSLGARSWHDLPSVVLPNFLPAILSGVALGFARAIGEFGSVVLISGNIPFETEVASVRIFGRIESDNRGRRRRGRRRPAHDLVRGAALDRGDPPLATRHDRD